MFRRKVTLPSSRSKIIKARNHRAAAEDGNINNNNNKQQYECDGREKFYEEQ
jgi:hypothetical protein